MQLSSQTDLNYGDQISSSNSPGPPAGDYRNTITEAVPSFTGGLSDGPGRNDSERRNLNERPNDNWDRDTRRDNLRHIALTTLQILDDGEYFPPGQDGPYDLRAKILWTDENTRYYGPDAGEGGEIMESEYIKINEDGGDEGKEEEEERNKHGITGAREEANDASYLNEKQGETESEIATAAAASKPDDGNTNAKDQATVPPDPPKRATLDNNQTTIYVGEYSTLSGARKVHLALARKTDPSANKKIGVLNFASAKKPGGGFINGSQAQEESLARASTLYPSLITQAASQFYTHYHEDPGNAYYTHAMVYSPGIVFIRDDNGEWRSPVEVDVLTSAAVNAGEIRRELETEERLRKERVVMEYWKKKGEERRKENERAMAERQRLREENNNAKEEIPKLKKEQANFVKSQTEMGMKKETDKGRAVAEVENENEEGEEVEEEKRKENQENTTDSPDIGLRGDSDSQLKGAEENTESKGTLVQDDQPQPEAPPEVNQEPNSSNTILSLPTQPPKAPIRDPNLTYAALALKNAEIQIEQTMYARISRILHLFQLHQTPHLILGSFGTGVFKNRIDLVATIFADLLIKPGGRFKDVFQTVVFAILGKETVRVFTEVFSRVDKRAQREGTGKTRVFVDSFGRESESDGDVKEGHDEKRMRMMKWKARRSELERRNSFLYDTAADTASFDPAQIDAAFNPLSFDSVQTNAVSYPNSSAAADVPSYTPSFDAAQADAAAYAASSKAFQASAAAYAAPSNAAQASVASYPPSFDAAKASAIPYPTSSTAAHWHADAVVQINPTSVDYYEIPEDAKMILTKDDEQVDFVAEATVNAPLTPEAMVVDDGKDVEMIEVKSLPSLSGEAHSSESNKKEDGDDESTPC